MGVFHVFKIVQMVPNRATHHNYEEKVTVAKVGKSKKEKVGATHR